LVNKIARKSLVKRHFFCANKIPVIYYFLYHEDV
jgi:hypothetical protein